MKQFQPHNLMVFMVDSNDHRSGKTGLTLTITASKNGLAFASITPTVTERGNGWYSLALDAAHTDTIGELALHITSAGADATNIINTVEPMGLGDLRGTYVTNLDATITIDNSVLSLDGVETFTGWMAVFDNGGWVRLGAYDGDADSYVITVLNITPNATGTLILFPPAVLSATQPLYAPATAGSDVVVLPVAATVSTGEVTGSSLVAYQNQDITYSFGIVDANEDAVNLSGKTLAFYASMPATQNTPTITRGTGGNGITISGTSNSTVNVSLIDTHTANLASFTYGLWNITDDMPLARGTLEILAIPQSV